MDPQSSETVEVQDRLPVREEANPPVAVIVFHGIGEQLPYETLSLVASSIVESRKDTPHAEPGDSRFHDCINGVGLTPGIPEPYAFTELELAVPESGACSFEYAFAPTLPPSDTRLVHMYENYWAPHTSRLVHAFDVIVYLVQAGWRGLSGCLFGPRFMKFRRRVFGRQIDYPLSVRTLGNLVAAQLVVFSITVLGLAVLAATLSRIAQIVIGTTHPDFVEALEIRLTLSAWDIGVAFTTSTLIFVAISLVAWLLNYRQHTWLARLRRVVLMIAVSITLGAIIAEGALVAATAFTYAGYGWGVADLRTERRWLLLDAHLPVLVDLTGETVPGEPPALIAEDVMRREVRIRALQRLFTLAIAVLAYWKARRVLIDYIGDVVVYVSAHRVSKYSATRAQIIDEARTLLTTVLAHRTDGRPTYEHVIIVGHSLGSVIAYDTYNELINDVSLEDSARAELDRVAAIVTLGSPLDKIAFLFNIPGEQESEVRQQYVEAMRPMIANYGTRPPRWINVWSWYDWIGAPLRFYDPPPAGDGEVIGKRIHSFEDLEGSFPLREHTRYWYHSGVRALLRAIVIGCDPLVVGAPKGLAGGENRPQMNADQAD